MKVTALVVMLTFLLVGCGGDSEDSGGKRPEPKQTTAAATDPADQAIADAALFTLKDFPAGWQAEAADDDGEDLDKQEIADCMDVDYDALYDEANASADSRNFISPDDVEVSNQVGIAPEEQWEKNAFEHFASDKFRECIVGMMQSVMSEAVKEEDEDFEVGEVTVNEMSFGSYGDATTAFRVTIPLESEDFSINAVLDYVAVRVGRGQTVINASGVGAGANPEDLAGYVDLAVKRLQEGLNEK